MMQKASRVHSVITFAHVVMRDSNLITEVRKTSLFIVQGPKLI
jgi:hypothetical protein